MSFHVIIRLFNRQMRRSIGNSDFRNGWHLSVAVVSLQILRFPRVRWQCLTLEIYRTPSGWEWGNIIKTEFFAGNAPVGRINSVMAKRPKASRIKRADKCSELDIGAVAVSRNRHCDICLRWSGRCRNSEWC